MAPSIVRAAIENPQLSGEGSFRWFGFKLYDARLWTAADTAASTSAAQDPLQYGLALELRYARKISGARIAQTSADELERLGFGTPVQRAGWLDQMRVIFPDVQAGTRLTGIHLPQRGAVFYLDQQRLGAIDDPAFARAFFSIWLDPRSAAPDLRAALLGKQP